MNPRSLMTSIYRIEINGYSKNPIVDTQEMKHLTILELSDGKFCKCFGSMRFLSVLHAIAGQIPVFDSVEEARKYYEA